MFSLRSALRFIFLSSCLFFAQSSFAEFSFSKKYAPYIGYEYSHSTYKPNHINSDTKYTPRFFAGITPIQKEHYKIGFEIGYTLPSKFQGTRSYFMGQYFMYYNTIIEAKNTDFYLTFDRSITKNIYWFLNPGLEYTQRVYTRFDNYNFHTVVDNNTIFLSAKTGIGYKFNNGLGINLFARSRICDFNHNDHQQKKLLLSANAEYTF